MDFPIIITESNPSALKSIPWTMISPHEDQAIKNHGQTLERLAERGGLSAYEAVCVLTDQSFDLREKIDKEKYSQKLKLLKEDYENETRPGCPSLGRLKV